MSEKKYTGSCLIGVVGGETEIGIARDSIEHLERRPGDEMQFCRATKGYEARQSHINNFIASKHDFLLFLDHDMVFAPDTLTKLRAHELPYISGLYMRRTVRPVAPIWFRPWAGRFPYEPWIGEPERGMLHKLGASGWGCVLVHRDVIMAVRKLLKGEYDVLEDDMDIWPYDLKAVMSAVNGISKLIDQWPDPAIIKPALASYLQILQSEIRPLRADREQIGSDIRFPFFALQAGYQLMGDPDVRPGHVLHYPLSPDDYQMPDEEARNKSIAWVRGEVMKDRARLVRQKKEVTGA